MARAGWRSWNKYALVHNEGIGMDAGGLPGLPVPKGVGKMAFGRRRGRGFRRRLRRPGGYELLFTDEPSNWGLAAGKPVLGSRYTLVPNGSPFITASNADIGTEEPPGFLRAGAGTGGQRFTVANPVRVAEAGGITVLVPLWDQGLAQQYDHRASLRSLRGYLFPTQVLLTSGGTAINNQMCRVRVTLFPLEVSEEAAELGGTLLNSAAAPVLVFSRSFQRRRIWWQRDWLIPTGNDELTYNAPFVGANDAAKNNGNEPLFASMGGSRDVKLKKLMTITRQRWPMMAISIQTNWPAGMINAPAGSGDIATLLIDGTHSCQVSMMGRLRAYVQK